MVDAQKDIQELRKAMDTILGSTPPEALIQRIPDEIRETLPADLTFAGLIALRVTLVASTAEKPEHVIQAAKLILDAQEKGHNRPPGHLPKPPILPSTEDQRRAFARELGVSLDEADSGDPQPA